MRAYLQLVRLPAVFTAMADIVLGFVLANGTLTPFSKFAALLGASSALYLAGMVFNDFFDRRIDAVERPKRPIPSGRVPPRAAFFLGLALFGVGLSCALAAGDRALAMAGLLVVLILAYDGLLKQTVLGPVAMGSCRVLNVLLGASGATLSSWADPALAVALAMGIYVAGITWFARQEAGSSSRAHLTGAALVIHAGIAALLAAVLIGRESSDVDRGLPISLLAAIMAFVDVRLTAAIRQPAGANVQAAVKRLLLAIILFDATMTYWASGNALVACGTLLLIVPAATLGRWIFIT
jgi:4-hydroxybenzoate polyprenyltransferase